MTTDLVQQADLPLAVHIVQESLHDGVAVRVRFANDYGASVASHRYSYGVELAVIKFAGEGEHSWDLVYDTPITSDVIGHLSPEELLSTLHRIAAL